YQADQVGSEDGVLLELSKLSSANVNFVLMNAHEFLRYSIGKLVWLLLTDAKEMAAECDLVHYHSNYRPISTLTTAPVGVTLQADYGLPEIAIFDQEILIFSYVLRSTEDHGKCLERIVAFCQFYFLSDVHAHKALD
ncbi:hypothetical protein ACJX0J_012801, partial [Zea mays]